MAKIKSGVWRCHGGFAAATKKGMVHVADGALVPHDHPYEVMEGREHLFVDVTEPKGAPVVEQATAAPGEKRSTRRKTSSAGSDD